MSEKKRLVKYFIIVITSAITIGCSTYSSYKSFEYKNEKESVSYRNDDLHVEVGIDRVSDFGSIGNFGLPIIPIYIRTSEEKELLLRVYIKMTSEHEFSVAPKPCLLGPNNENYCAANLKIAALGMIKKQPIAEKGGNTKPPIWEHISHFRTFDDPIIQLNKEILETRITNQKVYEYYNYKNNPKWEYFKVDLIYSIPCKDRCPEFFKINFKEFVKIDGKSISLETYSYKQEKRSKYYFIQGVQ